MANLHKGNLHQGFGPQQMLNEVVWQQFAQRLVQCAVLSIAFFAIPSSACAQTLRTQVKLNLSPPDTVTITIRPRQPLQTWSFLNSYAGVLGLGDRVQRLQEDSVGDPVAIKRIAPGVFRADHPVTSIIYELQLRLKTASSAAHVSWLTPDGGVLMLADLLPLEIIQEGAVEARFELPDGWQLNPFTTNLTLIEDPANAVVSVGPSLKTSFKKVRGLSLDVALSGSWPFNDARLTESAARVLKRYLDLTGFNLSSARILIVPLPVGGTDKWQAQTRGSTLLLLLDRRAGFQNWIAQLEVIFTHELLHLWVPNALNLQGDYDWFFEGFTLYQALVTALQLKVISFNEYLNTMARVYDSYLSKPDNLSLIEASEQRWTGTSSAVYDKGMLLAFLYDLEVIYETRAEFRLASRYADLFRKYSVKTANANDAIMSVLISSPATERLLKSHVEDRRELEFGETLKRYGLIVTSRDNLTDLKVTPDPTQEQRRLLKSIGYRR